MHAGCVFAAGTDNYLRISVSGSFKSELDFECMHILRLDLGSSSSHPKEPPHFEENRYPHPPIQMGGLEKI